MTKKLQTDYIDMYESVQEEMHRVSDFDETSSASTAYLGKVNMTRDESFKF